MKHCTNCNTNYSQNLDDFFCKDSTKKDGYDKTCKNCRKQYRLANKAKANERRKKANKLNGGKYAARLKAKYQYGGGYKCAVLNCDSKGQLHHLDYLLALDVVPLCRKHHVMAHNPIL